MECLISFGPENYVPLFIDDYLDRLFTSAQTLRIPAIHAKDEIRKF
jgi:hypothetical protein